MFLVHDREVDEELEKQRRFQQANHQYKDRLVSKKAQPVDKDHEWCPTLPKNPSKIRIKTFNPSTYHIAPVGFNIFKEFLKKSSLRWTKYFVPKSCPYCKNGPVYSSKITLLKSKLAEMHTQKTTKEGILKELKSKIKTGENGEECALK